MRLSLSQRDATWPLIHPVSGILRDVFGPRRQGPMRRSRMARLRRRGPKLALLALLLLAANVTLAVIAWVIVDAVLG